MNVPRSLNRFVPSLRTLHRVLTICVLVALLAGLIPPPLVRSALPAPVANAVADLLPEPAVAQAAAYSYEQTPNQAISDNSCPTGVTTTIAVADDFTINDLNVGLTIDHTYRNDLDVTLTSPAGTSVILFTDIGSNSTQNFDLLLDDAAATDIGSLTSGNHNTASPYYENLFNPEGAVVLSAFTGENAQGNWTLRVCDDAGSDTGTIRRVALQFDGTPTVIAIPGHIIGYVFQDYDSDGTKDSGPVVDGGVANVTVTAYDAAGATFSAVTDSTGAYDIDASAGTGPFRVEFTNLPSGYYPTYHNSNSGSNSAAPNSTATTAGTTVQFVPTAGVSNVNLGINRPLNYTAGAVGFAVSVMRASAASGQTNLATRYGYISLPYDATGDATGVGDKNNPDFTKDVAFADIGTTWGAAYQRRSGLLFAGAVMKRHQGLGPLVEPTVGAGVQNVPVDGIYMINYGGSVGGTKVGGFTLNGVTPAAGNLGAIDTGTVQRETINTTVTTAKPYALSTTSEDSFDVDAFNKAGKIGFGDVEISEDGQSLWIVNLNQKSLIRIDVSNFSGLPTSGAIDGALLAHYAIDFGELPACTGEYRPWGLNFHAGSGYIGVVCDGSSGTHGDLHAHVLEFDPVTVTGFTSVVDINLAPSTYVRESAQFETAYATCTLGTQQGWNRWANSWADLGVSGNTNTVFGGEAACPQPILSGIAFADNGDMILGLMDRSTLQLDRANWAADTAQGTTTFYSIDGGGDTIHVCDTAGGYVVEGFTGCVIDNDTKTTGDSPTTRLSAADGPNGQGEFYYGDYSSVYDTAGSARHVENNLGAVLTVPGSDQVLVTGYDVILGDFNQGFHWYQTRTGANPGARVSQYQISVEGANDVNTKGMNLGDIELLSPAAPIEIGNRIWNDADGDGIQDPDEAPISGVTVELYKNGVKIGEATSDATGEYYFTSGTNATDSDANDNIIHDSGIGILPGTGAVGGNSLYELRIPNITGGSKQAALGSNSLTTANAGSNDSIDSNGTVSGDDAIYAIPHADLADSGYNNHTYDFGFGPDAPDVGAITVNKTVNGAPAPAGWQFTLSSSNCTLPGGLTNPATTADGSGGSVSWANLLVEDGSSSACLYIVSETVQSGYTLSTTLSSSLTGITLTANMTTPLTVVNVEDTLPPSKVSIGNLVWEDGNDNARYDVGEDLIDNLTMELWLDLDNDGIAEPLGDDGSTPLSTTVTVNGIYSFTNLMPGNYFVRIPAPPPVTPLSSIPSDAPDNGVDNDDNGSQPGGPNTQILSPVIVLIAGEEPGQGGGGNDDMTVDFGLVDPFIGNLVWYDKNNDGDVDVDEPGIPGVTVQVFLDADDNGTIDAGESTPFRTTTTNQEGIYTFSDLLPASNYLVVIPQSNFVAGGALALYRYSSDNTDTNDNQEDEDDNGIQASPGLTTTAPMVRLTVDEEPTDGDSETGRGNDLDNGDDNNGDMTVDFGFYSMGTIQIVKQATGGDDTFTFSSADGDLDGLSLTTSGGVAGSTVITKLVGAYTISETLPTDWFLIGISVSGDSDNGSSKDLVNGAMTIDLDANEQIVVTFKNIKGELPTGSSVLTITKSVVGDPGGITSYTVAVDGSTGYYTETTVTPGAPTVLTGLAAGIYTVTETSPGAGWVMTYTVDAVTSNTEGVVDLTNAANVTPVTAGPISGKVFRDFNSDGLITADGTVTDSGVSGVTVTAYDKDGNPAGSATTGIDGTYTINPTADGPYRVEFTNLPDGFEPTTRGTGNGTSVQFVTTSGAGNVNLGVNPPCDYCQDNVNLVDTLMNIGVQTGPNQSPPSPNPAFPDARNKTTVALFPSTSSNYTSGTASNHDLPAATQLGTGSETGAVWGVAYARPTKKLYVSALFKKHVGFGPGGPGAIYVLDLSGTVLNTFTVPNATANAHNTADYFNDNGNTAWEAVGKQSLGGIAAADDGKAIFVMNLENRTLYKLDATTGSVLASQAVPLSGSPTPGGTNATCAASDVRPWAVKYYMDKVYVGMVCSAQSTNATQDLFMYVYTVDPTTLTFAATPVLAEPLDYARGVANITSPGGAGREAYAEWNPWSATFQNVQTNDRLAWPQPILADIEFDQGNMILVLNDRNGHQGGNALPSNPSNTATLYQQRNAGDILRACGSPQAGWTLESNGSCGGVTTAGAGNHQGPGSGYVTKSANNETSAGEYYHNDNYELGVTHQETSVGGAAQIPGRATVAVTAFDPIQLSNNFHDGGVAFLNNTTGSSDGSYRQYNGDNSGSAIYSTFGKGVGLGDIVALCDAPPLEIGNRVWDDLDGDGVQDPGEPGLNGIQVSLQGPTGTVSVNTSGDGNYYFTVQADTEYTITVAVPSGYALTARNADSVDGLSASSNHAISDTRDSDAILVGGLATIHYTTGNAGQNNHGLDFGFTQPASGQVDILNSAPPVVADPGGFSISKAIAATDGSSPSVSGSFDVVVNCAGVSDYPTTLSLNADGTPITAGNLVSGTVCSFSEDTLTLPAAPNGYTWVNAQISPASITIVGNMTATVTAHNTLAPLPEPPTHVLTVTKTISGTGSGPFDITITGPSGYITNTQINGGDMLTFNVPSTGIYTVTESTPTGWTTVYTATPGSVSSVSGVVTVANANTATLAATPISGMVFRDFNSDGLITANGTITDTGVAGVTVTAYDKSDNNVGSATTDSNGDYTINPSGDGPYRVEFSDLPSGYQPTTQGVDNGTSTQFVTTSVQAGNINFGVGQPSQYCGVYFSFRVRII